MHQGEEALEERQRALRIGEQDVIERGKRDQSGSGRADRVRAGEQRLRLFFQEGAAVGQETIVRAGAETRGARVVPEHVPPTAERVMNRAQLIERHVGERSPTV